MEQQLEYQHLEYLLDGIAIVDRHGTIVFANSVMAELLRTSVRRMKNQNIKDLLRLRPEEWEELGSFATIDSPTAYSRFEYEIGDSPGELGIMIAPFEITPGHLLVCCRDLSLERSLHAKYQTTVQQKEAFFKAHQRKLFEVLFLSSMAEKANEVQTAEQLFAEYLPKIIEIAELYAVGFLVLSKDNDFQMRGLASKDKITSKILRNLTDRWKADFLDILKSKKPSLKDMEAYRALIIPVSLAPQSSGLFVAIHGADQQMNDEQSQMVITMAQQMAVHWERIRLRSDVMLDPLTQIYNKRYFEMKLDLDLKNTAKLQSPLTLIMLDIDHFKKFNDQYGHQTGDLVLQQLVAVVKKNLRSYDTFARYGGEEFVIILPDSPLDSAMQIAERIRTAIENHQIDPARPQLKMTSSFGIACSPQHATVKEELIEKADQALYKSKGAGRNRITVADGKLS